MKSWLLIQPKAALKNLYSRAIWNFDRSENCIYITFDDGPIEGLTDWVIEELNKYNAKATFFCVGANIIKNNAVFQRVKQNGHTVANHTMFHSKGFKTDLVDYIQDVDSCEAFTQNKLFRPPYGQIKRSQYKALINKGYKIIFWDVVSYDYEKIEPQIVLEKLLKHTKPGSIILFHDNIKAEQNLKYALPLFLKHFSELGYAFKTLPS